MTIRPFKPEEMGQARLLWEECFEDDPSFLDWYFHYRFYPQDGLGLFAGQQLLSDLHLSPRKIKIRRTLYPSAYLIALATKPTFRNQGLAKRLLTFSLRHLATNKIFFTFLMPFNIEFYTRLGWEVCYHHHLYTLPAGLKVNSLNNLRVYQSEPSYAFLAKIYHLWSERFDGALRRAENDWQCLLYDHFSDSGKIWLASNETSEPLGYALTLTPSKTEKQLLIRELAYTNPSLAKPLLAQPSAHHLGTALFWTAPAENNFCTFTPTAVRPVLLGRITDVRQALEALTYPPINFKCILEICDPLLPENTGKYRLMLTAGQMRVLKTGDEVADLRCSIGTLTRIMIGTAWPKEEVLDGKLKLNSPELLPLLDILFPKTTNYINEYF